MKPVGNPYIALRVRLCDLELTASTQSSCSGMVPRYAGAGPSYLSGRGSPDRAGGSPQSNSEQNLRMKLPYLWKRYKPESSSGIVFKGSI